MDARRVVDGDPLTARPPRVRKALLSAIKIAYKAGEHDLADALQIIRRNWLGLKPEPPHRKRERA